jgi:hypothetical protein
VLNITDDSGKQIRRLELAKELGSVGVHRLAWDLRGEPPAEQASSQGGGRGGRGGGAGAPDQEMPQFGRGQVRQGPLVGSGRYKASIGRVSGETFTAIGEPQSFLVVPLPR